MLGRDIIYLNTETITINSIGDSVKTLVEKMVYADKLAINQSEFYQAMATELRPEVKFKIRFADFSDEGSFKYNSKQYNIIRTYSKDDEWIELTGSALNNG